MLFLGLVSAMLPGAAASAGDDATADPEEGSVRDGIYTNPYFALSFPLPMGWRAGFTGPPPSLGGYYVLIAPLPGNDEGASLVVTAQDMFFAEPPLGGAMDFIESVARSATASGMRLERAPSRVVIAGHDFARVDLSSLGMTRIIFATELRCHVLSFALTASNPALLDGMVTSLAQARLPTGAVGERPRCVKDYATKANLLRRVDPRLAAPGFARIPVRLAIDGEGRVRHVHVIRASPEQRKVIAEALRQWRFRPHRDDGHPIAIETGLLLDAASLASARE
jgi:hypothetical protein